MKLKNYTLRVEAELLDKFKHVVNYEGRTIKSKLSIFMRECVEDFEEEHEKIEL